MSMSEKHYYNRHEYVDLGLPSGTLWATCNVGADNPENGGDCFAWGETKTKSNFDWSNEGEYKWGVYNSSDTNHGMTKYNQTDGKTVLEAEDDAAHVNWGGDWRMPTQEEIQELLDECAWTYENNYQDSNIEGILFQSNGISLFIPSASVVLDNYTYTLPSIWTSTIYDYCDNAIFLYYQANSLYTDQAERCSGLFIRPVISKDVIETEKSKSFSVNVSVSESDANLGSVKVEIVSENEINEDGKYQYGTKLKISATPHYTNVSFVNWENYPEYSQEFTITVEDNMRFIAHFATPEYPIEYVDLGLSVMWATCNIGASSPEEFGDYFAWGETIPKDSYYLNDYTLYDEQFNTYIKYNGDDQTMSLMSIDDVATKNSGTSWQIPTSDNFNELINNCTQSYTTNYGGKGVSGYIFTSKKNNSELFFPSSGSKREDSFVDGAHYWTSDLSSGNTDYANAVGLISDNDGLQINTDSLSRCWGLCIRPCQREGSELIQYHEYVDLGLPSGTLWATCNVGADSLNEIGEYFAWGETEPKNNYDWSNEGDYKWGVYTYNADLNYGMTKYTSSDGLTTLEAIDDAATANWGKDWCMPTSDDFNELLTYTKYTNHSNIINLYAESDSNKNLKFFSTDNDDLSWTSSLQYSWRDCFKASAIKHYSTLAGANGVNRCNGIPVRPILKKKSNNPKKWFRLTIKRKIDRLGVISINYNNNTNNVLSTNSVVNTYTRLYPENAELRIKLDLDGDPRYKLLKWSDGNYEYERTIKITKDIELTVDLYEDKEDSEVLPFVDLGLPSGTLWATCNVGAKKSYEWGEWTDDLNKELGESYVIPNSDSFYELFNSNNCICNYTENYKDIGISGVIVQSKKNSNTLFLPSARQIKSDDAKWFIEDKGNSSYLTNDGVINYNSNFQDPSITDYNDSYFSLRCIIKTIDDQSDKGLYKVKLFAKNASETKELNSLTDKVYKFHVEGNNNPSSDNWFYNTIDNKETASSINFDTEQMLAEDQVEDSKESSFMKYPNIFSGKLYIQSSVDNIKELTLGKNYSVNESHLDHLPIVQYNYTENLYIIQFPEVWYSTDSAVHIDRIKLQVEHAASNDYQKLYCKENIEGCDSLIAAISQNSNIVEEDSNTIIHIARYYDPTDEYYKLGRQYPQKWENGKEVNQDNRMELYTKDQYNSQVICYMKVKASDLNSQFTLYISGWNDEVESWIASTVIEFNPKEVLTGNVSNLQYSIEPENNFLYETIHEDPSYVYQCYDPTLSEDSFSMITDPNISRTQYTTVKTNFTPEETYTGNVQIITERSDVYSDIKRAVDQLTNVPYDWKYLYPNSPSYQFMLNITTADGKNKNDLVEVLYIYHEKSEDTSEYKLGPKYFTWNKGLCMRSSSGDNIEITPTITQEKPNSYNRYWSYFKVSTSNLLAFNPVSSTSIPFSFNDQGKINRFSDLLSGKSDYIYVLLARSDFMNMYDRKNWRMSIQCKPDYPEFKVRTNWMNEDGGIQQEDREPLGKEPRLNWGAFHKCEVFDTTYTISIDHNNFNNKVAKIQPQYNLVCFNPNSGESSPAGYYIDSDNQYSLSISNIKNKSNKLNGSQIFTSLQYNQNYDSSLSVKYSKINLNNDLTIGLTKKTCYYININFVDLSTSDSYVKFEFKSGSTDLNSITLTPTNNCALLRYNCDTDFNITHVSSSLDCKVSSIGMYEVLELEYCKATDDLEDWINTQDQELLYIKQDDINNKSVIPQAVWGCEEANYHCMKMSYNLNNGRIQHIAKGYQQQCGTYTARDSSSTINCHNLIAQDIEYKETLNQY